MDLKNITTFEEFKKILEASIPNEFSNNTGFKESLVGRAVFGILRYFQKGINLGKLEYYKRKLENEYFAGLLRFCALKEINLQTGMGPATPTPQPDDPPLPTADPHEQEYCGILAIDYIIDSNGNTIYSHENNFKQYVTDLQDIIADPNTQDDVKNQAQEHLDFSNNMIKCCADKRAINDKFKELAALTNGSIEATKVIPLLDAIKDFLESDLAKKCTTYKGTDNEKNLLKGFASSVEQTIKDKATNEIVPLLDNFNYSEYDLIEEAITSSLNKSIGIAQMLGDQLTAPGAPAMKVNIFQWLKDHHIDDVNKINFVELQKLFASKGSGEGSYKTEASKYVNQDGIKKIQYAVSRIIFHTKKSPDDVGANPGVGGKIDYDEDTQLKTSWEKKVEFVKSEFVNFLDVEEALDPFRLLNLTDAMRARGKYSADPLVLNYAASTAALGNSTLIASQKTKLGIKPQGNADIVNEGGLFVYTVKHNNVLFYPVFKIKSEGNTQVYKYLGCINFQKILADKEYDKSDFKNNAHNFVTPVWGTTTTDSDIAAINLMKLKPLPVLNNYIFDSLYLSDTGYKRINSYAVSPVNKNVRLLYLFIDNTQSNGAFKGPKGGADKFGLKYLHNGNLKNITNIGKVKTETDNVMLRMEFGEVYEIEQSWFDTYFPSFHPVTLSKYMTTQPCINQDPYKTKILLKN